MTSDDNPYQAPISSAPLRSRHFAEREAEDADYRRMARWAQMYLRLIGVMLIIESVGGVIGGVVNMFVLSNSYFRAGYTFEWDAYSWCLIASSATILLGGVYLTIGGRWLLENVFLPAPPIRDEEAAVAEEVAD